VKHEVSTAITIHYSILLSHCKKHVKVSYKIINNNMLRIQRPVILYIHRKIVLSKGKVVPMLNEGPRHEDALGE